MTKRPSTEDRLAKLRELESAALSPNVKKDLGVILAGANSILVARAAQVVSKRRITELIPNLVTAFNRFMSKPPKADQGCLSKIAIIEALDNLDYDDDDVFLRGIHHVQKEPAYGGPIDTAANLRGKCAFALARIGDTEVLFELITLLMDPEPQARIAAVKAVAHLACRESELLLRMKILAGDMEPDVLGECFSGLISINPDRSLSFVGKFLVQDDHLIAEVAAFALGESRETRAFEILHNYREENVIKPEFQQVLLLSIALTRLDGAFEYLTDVVANEHTSNGIEAIKALKIYAYDDELCAKIDRAVVSRNDVMLSEAYASEFDSSPILTLTR